MISVIFWLAGEVLWLYTWAVIIAAVLSTLTSFGVLDSRNRVVWTFCDFFYRVTEPALRPIRKRMPDLGGIDLSPLVLILLLLAAQAVLRHIEAALFCLCLAPLLI